jgi:hypothetical protein
MSYSQFPSSRSDPPPTYKVVQQPEGIFEVIKSYPPTAYTVMVTEQGVTCSCPDYWKWGVDKKVTNYACKHIQMVADKVKEMTADKRPPAGSKQRAKSKGASK